jgi:hypothetical protein
MFRRTNHALKLVLFSMIASCLLSTGAGAVSEVFYDTSSSSGTCDILTWDGGSYACDDTDHAVRLRVGNIPNVPSQRVHVKAYYNGTSAAAIAATNPYIEVDGAYFCPGAGRYDNMDAFEDGYYGASSSRRKQLYDSRETVTRYYVGGVYNPSTDTASGVIKDVAYMSASGSYCGYGSNSDMRIYAGSASLYQPVPGVANLYSLEILIKYINRAPGIDGITNGMRLIARGSGTPTIATVGAASDNFTASGYGVTVANSHSTATDNSNFPYSERATSSSYRLRFGSDCSIAAGDNKWVAIPLYDVDFTAGYYQSPIHLRLKDITLNKWKKLNTWTNTVANKNLTSAQEWSLAAAPTYAQADEPPSRNSVTQYYYFHAQQNHKYVFDFLNNNGTLVFQYGLPFDAIYSQVDCSSGFVKPAASIAQSNVTAGDTVTANATIDYDGAGSTTVKRKRDFWFSNSNDWTTPPSATPKPPSINQDNTGVAYAQGSATTNLPVWSATADGNYKYVCTKIAVTPTNPIKANPTQDGQCIPIGKYPSVKITNGDTRSGGVVPVNSLCTIQDGAAAGLIQGHSFNAGTSKGSVGALGVLSGGTLKDFGSGGLFAASGDLSKRLYFSAGTAYSPGLGIDGLYYLDQSKTLDDISTGNISHCLTDLTASYPPLASSIPIGASTSVVSPASGAGVQNLQYEFASNNGSDTPSILSIPGYALSTSQKVQIRVKGPTDCETGTYIVRLTGDVKPVASSFATIYTLPQFSLIASSPCIRIVVQDTVTSLYGLYATSGDLTTCAGLDNNGFNGNDDVGYTVNPGDPALTTANCSNGTGLTFNGTVIVGQTLYPYRTNGDGSTAAETFNLDPTFTLSDYARSRANDSLRVDSQTELPPRY